MNKALINKAKEQVNTLAASVVTGYIQAKLNQQFKPTKVNKEATVATETQYVSVAVEKSTPNTTDKALQTFANKLKNAPKETAEELNELEVELKRILADIKTVDPKIAEHLLKEFQKEKAKIIEYVQKKAQEGLQYTDNIAELHKAAATLGEINSFVTREFQKLEKIIEGAKHTLDPDVYHVVMTHLLKGQEALKQAVEKIIAEIKAYLTTVKGQSDTIVKVRIMVPDAYDPTTITKFSGELHKEIAKVTQELKENQTLVVEIENPLAKDKIVAVYEGVSKEQVAGAFDAVVKGTQKVASTVTEAFAVTKTQIQKMVGKAKVEIDTETATILAYILGISAALIGAAVALYMVARARRTQLEGNYELYAKYAQYINVESAISAIENLDTVLAVTIFTEQNTETKGRVSGKFIAIVVLALLAAITFPIWAVLATTLFGVALGFGIGVGTITADKLSDTAEQIKAFLVENKVVVGGFALGILAAIVLTFVIRKLTKQRVNNAQKNQVITPDVVKQARKAGAALTAIA